MPYKIVEGVAMADVAYEVTGQTLEEMFASAGLALTDTQVKNANKLKKEQTKELNLKAKNIEQLLHDFLQELIFYKDADVLLLNKFDIKITKTTEGYELKGKTHGEEIDMKKHELLVDVKAVSWHMFKVEQSNGLWRAFVILDV